MACGIMRGQSSDSDGRRELQVSRLARNDGFTVAPKHQSIAPCKMNKLLAWDGHEPRAKGASRKLNVARAIIDTRTQLRHATTSGLPRCSLGLVSRGAVMDVGFSRLWAPRLAQRAPGLIQRNLVLIIGSSATEPRMRPNEQRIAACWLRTRRRSSQVRLGVETCASQGSRTECCMHRNISCSTAKSSPSVHIEAAHLRGMNREEWVAPIPGRPCLTGL